MVLNTGFLKYIRGEFGGGVEGRAFKGVYKAGFRGLEV